jgi:hypothetical protein
LVRLLVLVLSPALVLAQRPEHTATRTSLQTLQRVPVLVRVLRLAAVSLLVVLRLAAVSLLLAVSSASM